MRKIKMPDFDIQQMAERCRSSFHQVSQTSFQQIYSHIDQLRIKKGVDQLGIDKFINQCAFLAAGSGLISGIGGVSTLVVGIPLDMINLVTQQFRVTLAVSYYKTGSYQLHFDDFIKLLTSSMQGDTGVMVTKKAMEEVSQKLMLNMGTKATKRMVPFVGAVIGGSSNYLFIKRIGESLKLAN